MPDPLTAAEMAALATIMRAGAAINAHLSALRSIAASVTPVPVPSIPPPPIERVPLNPVPMRDPVTGRDLPPIRASLIGEPMQQKPIMPPARTDAMSTLSLKGWEAPGGVEVKPDNA